MLTSKPLSADERHLTRLLRTLGDDDRRTLLAFAQYLAAGGRAAMAPEPPTTPVALPRPERESVIAAVRRLSQTYPMLDRGAMLNDSSALVSAHVLQGRQAALVIDDLETLFLRHYHEYQEHLAAVSGAAPGSSTDGGPPP
ncbi:MAG TPA: hypothetical protein VES73_17035 [Lamprocystis sp. (in: g-proteobacteria)]|nr:hypothetical protein [Lamprocystis sp. (in: g-proteobacteria)]